VSDGTCSLALRKNKDNLFIPIIFVLKALIDTTDQDIYVQLVKGQENDQFVKSCALNMLRQSQDHGIIVQKDALKYLGERLRVKADVAEWYSVEEVAKAILKRHICVHLESNLDKFNVIMYVISFSQLVHNYQC
jgi:DNA-directed RNA polymerase I subunit RPA2